MIILCITKCRHYVLQYLHSVLQNDSVIQYLKILYYKLYSFTECDSCCITNTVHKMNLIHTVLQNEKDLLWQNQKQMQRRR